MVRASIRVLGLPAALLLGTAVTFGQPALTTIRAVAMSPDRFVNRPVTVAGRFRGRTPGDGTAAIQPLNRSRWDFVLKVEEASVWVSGIRPAGWDFDLDPLSPADSRTGRWLEVTGTVRVDAPAGQCPGRNRCSRVWIEASDLRPASAPATATATGHQPMFLRPAVYPPAVVFHDPIDDERGVDRGTAVRLQFSRHMIAETFSEHVRVSYAAPRRLLAPPMPRFTAVYQEATRSLSISFAGPLDEFQTVKVELLDGIAALNGRTLEPWSFSFTTGS